MNDGRECRICMIGDDEEELIQPCRCTTAYVHESCLQKWREENIDNERYNHCEICKADYLIRREFPKETFELEKTFSLKTKDLHNCNNQWYKQFNAVN